MTDVKIQRIDKRIDILDAIRGIAIVAMVFYHAFYDINDIFGLNFPLFSMLSVLEPPFAGAFILLAGMSSQFSHSNYKRGAKVLGVAYALTLVTVLFTHFSGDNETIVFGILHFMGFAIIIYAVFRKIFEKIPPIPALVLYLALFILTYCMPLCYFVGIPPALGFPLPMSVTKLPWLFAFGIPGPNFSSADYFPLIPWLFLFMAGTVLGIPVKKRKLPEKFYTARVPFFAFAGRHTLLIYIIHQPLILAILYFIIDGILRK